MPQKDPKYTIYGFTPGTTSHPQSPIGGSQQPVEVRKMENIKVEVEHILQGLDIKYPIKSKKEFLDIIVADFPDMCVLENKKLSLRDLIFMMKDSDFPIQSDHEAAILLAASCPITAQAADF
jgi:hypothetical protein